MKRSAGAEQTLDLNRIDFEHTGKPRKGGYKFNVEFIDGKPTNALKDEFAQPLILELMGDDVTKALLLQNNYQFNFNSKYQLSIKNTGRHQDTSLEELNAEPTSLPV